MKKPFFFILFSLLSVVIAFAQGGGPSDPPGPPGDDGNIDDTVPIDDHIWIIIIIAIVFGFYVLRTKRLQVKK